MSSAVKNKSRWRSLELIAGAILIVSMVLAVIVANVYFFDAATRVNLAARLLPPFTDTAHLFGTDPLGHDVLTRVLAGGSVSLQIGFYSVLASLLIGVVVGLLAGYYRGLSDMLVMRFADIQLALPFILLALTFTAILGGGFWQTMTLLVVSQWVQYARLVRSSVLSLSGQEFILSARAIGVSAPRILLQHLLPNLLGPVIVLMTLNIANNILLESSLTFLGIGADLTAPSWGGMLADGRTYLQSAWWVSVFPGMAILLTVLGLNLLGDWLRDTLDPKQQQR